MAEADRAIVRADEILARHDGARQMAGLRPGRRVEFARENPFAGLLRDMGDAGRQVAAWVHDRGTRMNEPEFDDDEGGPRPASNAAIDALPRKKVKESDKEKIGTDCPICFSAYAGDDTLVELPCGHEFHDDCVVHWLKEASTCPMCRYEVEKDEEEGMDRARLTAEEEAHRDRQTTEEVFETLASEFAFARRPVGGGLGFPTIQSGGRGLERGRIGRWFEVNVAQELNRAIPRRPRQRVTVNADGSPEPEERRGAMFNFDIVRDGSPEPREGHRAALDINIEGGIFNFPIRRGANPRLRPRSLDVDAEDAARDAAGAGAGQDR